MIGHLKQCCYCYHHAKHIYGRSKWLMVAQLKVDEKQKQKWRAKSVWMRGRYELAAEHHWVWYAFIWSSMIMGENLLNINMKLKIVRDHMKNLYILHSAQRKIYEHILLRHATQNIVTHIVRRCVAFLRCAFFRCAVCIFA